jgi:serine/threonine protein kinase
MKELKHPNVISSLENFTEDGICYLVMEYAELGDLYEYAIDRS